MRFLKSEVVARVGSEKGYTRSLGPRPYSMPGGSSRR